MNTNTNTKLNKFQHALLYYIPQTFYWENEEEGRMIYNFFNYSKKVGNFPSHLQEFQDVMQNGWIGLMEARQKVLPLNISEVEKARRIGGFFLSGCRNFVLKDSIDCIDNNIDFLSLIASIEGEQESIETFQDDIMDCFKNKQTDSLLLEDVCKVVYKKASPKQKEVFKKFILEKQDKEIIIKDMYPNDKNGANKFSKILCGLKKLIIKEFKGESSLSSYENIKNLIS